MTLLHWYQMGQAIRQVFGPVYVGFAGGVGVILAAKLFGVL